MKCRLNQEQYNVYQKFLIKESQESDSQKLAIDYYLHELRDKTKEDAEHYVRKELRLIVPSLNGNAKAGKFTFGACRLCLNRKLSVANYQYGDNVQYREGLSLAIKTLTNNPELYKSFDKNLNGLGYRDLIKKVYPYIHHDYEDDVEEKEDGNLSNSDYEIVPIDSYEQASQYGDYTSWCVTHYLNMYNHYTDGGRNKFFFLLKKGYKNVKKKQTDNSPFDEYGLSMIAISVTKDGSLNTATSRWNHDINGYGDRFANIDKLIEITKLDLRKLVNISGSNVKDLYKNKELVKSIRNFEKGFDPKHVKTYRDLMLINNEVQNLRKYLLDDFNRESPIYFYDAYTRESGCINSGYFYTLYFRDLQKGYIFSLPNMEIKLGEIPTLNMDEEAKCIYEIDRNVTKCTNNDFGSNIGYISNYAIIFEGSEYNKVDKIIDRNGEEVTKYGKIDRISTIFPPLDRDDEDYREAWLSLVCGKEVYLVDGKMNLLSHLNKEIKYDFNDNGYELKSSDFIAPRNMEGDWEPSQFIKFTFTKPDNTNDSILFIYDRWNKCFISSDKPLYSYENPTTFDIFLYHTKTKEDIHYYRCDIKKEEHFKDIRESRNSYILQKDDGKYVLYHATNYYAEPLENYETRYVKYKFPANDNYEEFVYMTKPDGLIDIISTVNGNYIENVSSIIGDFNLDYFARCAEKNNLRLLSQKFRNATFFVTKYYKTDDGKTLRYNLYTRDTVFFARLKESDLLILQNDIDKYTKVKI